MKPQEELQWAICRDTVKEEMETKEIFTEPSTEAKLWVLEQIAQFIIDTQAFGSFRNLINDYLNLNYGDAYDAGAMVITNSISTEYYHKHQAKHGNRKTDTSDSWAFLKNVKLFDPEHILQVFRNYPWTTEIPPYTNLGKVRCKNFSIITNDNGEAHYHFDVYLTTTTITTQEETEK